MSDTVSVDLTTEKPDDRFSSAQRALWWLKKGNLQTGSEWAKAHSICQNSEDDSVHDWIHALCHLIEGDTGNATYWFRRAGKPTSLSNPSALWRDIWISANS